MLLRGIEVAREWESGGAAGVGDAKLLVRIEEIIGGGKPEKYGDGELGFESGGGDGLIDKSDDWGLRDLVLYGVLW